MKKANQVVYAEDILDQIKAKRMSANQWVEEWYPIYLGVITKIVYDSKVDRYTAQFGEGSSVRVAVDVAQFLIQHAVAKGQFGKPLPTVHAIMEDGIVVSVTALFLSRQ